MQNNLSTTTKPFSDTTDPTLLPEGAVDDRADKMKLTLSEQEQIHQVFRAGDGLGLIKFCRELAVILVRKFDTEKDATSVRTRLSDSIVNTLNCTRKQAESLIDLSLELIHFKVHGEYRRSEIELSYLIAKATGVVDKVSNN